MADAVLPTSAAFDRATLAPELHRNLVDCPPFQAPVQLLRAQAESAGAIGEHHSLAPKLDDAVVGAVSVLGVPRRPATVGRLVMPIHINTVERLSGRATPHVPQENRETLAPLSAHPDAATTVLRVAGAGRILTAIDGVPPGAILPRTCATHRRAMLQAPQARRLRSEATAAGRPATTERIGDYDGLTPAVASASPDNPSTPMARARHGDKPPKPLSRKVYSAHRSLAGAQQNIAKRGRR